MQRFFAEAAAYVVRNRHHRTWLKIVSCLACIVVFCTTYALILPAITLENKNTYCGYEEHEHDGSCYTQELICEYEAGEGAHTHSADCYDSEGVLVCDQEESEGHVHTDACYGEPKLTCGEEEHIHLSECYINPDADEENTGDSEGTPSENPDTGAENTEYQEGTPLENPDAEVEETGEDTEEETDELINALAVDESQVKTLNVSETKPVTEFYLWLWAYMGSQENPGAAVEVNLQPKWIDGNGWDGLGIQNVLTYTDTENEKETQIYYLIPVAYFTENYGKYGYTFDEENINTSDCPFFYAPDADDKSNLTPASYVYVQADADDTDETGDGETKAGWYVQVQDTTGLSPARSNIYYYVPKDTLIEVDNFKLWLWEGSIRATTTAEKVFNSDNDDDGLITVLQRAGSNSYLIPIDIFEDHLSSKYYTFDENETAECPFYYAPDASDTTNLELASYVYVEDDADVTDDGETKAGWYVEVQDTGLGSSYSGEPRSNVYYYDDDLDYSEVENTVNHPGSVINLFDYWIDTKNVADAANEKNNFTSGINADHALKFSFNGSLNGVPGKWNQWTGSEALYSGIVKNTLTDGYPQLSGNGSVFTGTDESFNTTESLAYLFDPTETSNYKETHRNVSGLLQVDAQGYYYYDSSKNFAEYHENTNSFTLYDTWGVLTGGKSPNGQFFPFNSMAEVANVKSTDESINHYLGMTLTTRFVQQYGGHTTAGRMIDTVFNFAGDDDVWIFIDDVLVADLGGIHDRASVSIDFATGVVDINNGSDQSTTLKDAFEAAEKEPTGGWDEESGTFADNTYHTLKFYYLERGNTDSNLWLQYNLSPYPETGIYKVNQYGQPVEGATFAVYAASDSYQMLDKLKGNTVKLSGNETYNLNPDSQDYGSIMNGSSVVAKALYTGTTDETGQMIFVDEDEMPYTLTELENMFGDHFLLKEIAVPDGYRLVSDEVKLKIVNHQVMLCDNTYESGIYASPNLQVVAPNTIMLTDPGSNKALPSENAYIRIENGRTVVDYYDVDGKVNGTVFAVVLKYTGDGEAGLTQQKNWAPIYGTDEEGFTVVDVKGDFIAAAIDTAKRYQESDNVFEFAGNGQMQGGLNGMPGDISTYYYMLDANSKGETKYTVAYYWTSASSLDKATSANTWRVDADADTAGKSYAFSRSFGATIAVPNLLNRLFVQKLDEDGSLVNGAKFAMYDVEEVKDASGTSSTIYYIAEDKTRIYLEPDTDGDNEGDAQVKGETTKGTYEVNSNTGVIKVTIGNATYTIEPERYAMESGGVATTRPAKDKDNNPSGEDGTATFTNMDANTYYVREISAPAGYQLNTTEVMVLVDDSAVYANAGTADDGVTVARGPGYVVSTLDQFASQGDIDNTLSWIYEMMRVSDVSTSFKDSDFSDGNTPQWGYLTTNGDGTKTTTATNNVHDASNALRTYLEYAPDSDNSLFNYVVNQNRGGKGTQRRLYTNVGWSYYEIYQDWRWALGYGDITRHVKEGANYTILTSDGKTGDNSTLLEIANLFSRSTYIQVTDQKTAGDLEISKTVEKVPEEDTTEYEFTFTVNLYKGTMEVTETGEDGTKVTVTKPAPLTGKYTYTVYNVVDVLDGDGKPTGETKREAANGEDGKPITGTISSGGTITLTDKQVVVIENLPAGTQYTITETDNTKFSTTAEEKVLAAPAVDDEESEEGDGEESQEGDDEEPEESGDDTSTEENGDDETSASSPPYWKPYTFGPEDERTVSGSLYWYVDEKGEADTTSVVNYTNTYLPSLKILKVDAANNNTVLPDAEFVLYKTVTVEGENGEKTSTETYYYPKDGSWVQLSESETEDETESETEETVITLKSVTQATDANGTITYSSIPDGTYYLKEITAPDGYNLLEKEIEIQVKGGKITSAQIKGSTTTYTIGLANNVMTLTVPNNPGITLPDTGGQGTYFYTYGGLLLTAGAVVCGYALKRKRERRTID